MKNVKNLGLTLIIAFGSALITLWAYTKFFNEPQVVRVEQQQAMRYANLPSAPQGKAPDLTYAAENSVHAVVHVKVVSKENVVTYSNPFYDWFYGDRYQRQQPRIREGSGSGVIMTEDGYIVTNNHVIDRADEIKVVLNDKREYEAKLVGTDRTTDVALLKIDANDLPHLSFGNSDALKLGEWVLAVGNPFNLTSTVTAGIVSAKGRNIGINRTDMSIESFIQTDAAVNPGNSGGALVNMNGELVGINTAIASQTGSYTGYSFAIPSAIVQKVIADLKQYGQVQRALLGVSIGDVNAEVAEKYGLDKIEGVFVAGVSPDGAAREAGLEPGDVILAVDGVTVNSVAELQEQVSKHRPGDEVKILTKRDNKSKPYKVTLRNMHGDTEILTTDANEFLGAKFDNVTENEKYKLRISQGIKITELSRGKLKDAGLSEGFIITQVNKQEVNGVNDFVAIVKKAKGGIFIEGVYQNGERAYFVFSTED
ncbi:Do family serine endopeptidase [Mangrovibacterium marinum]|uniref:Do/DeqQ family serine protease n=1 Tax=Mangrovibacterium marinum TaxID=1639118 RepID=A0A2T5BZA4_9BACT|nr:Do family serine endopeptidase [Mangrovibacterium marinum]PTN07601.1 Do/DeqQ family serine protease [Mangrovibacterium marinum]